MSEKQYKRYDNIPPTKLGKMVNQTWTEDPKMLGIRLARYKFVARMLEGCAAVAEIGCGDGFMSRVVENVVGEMALFDLDPTLSDNEAEMYDVAGSEPLPGPPYDGIYSLDCFEHIPKDDMSQALINVRHSLCVGGTFICGMPSLESQEYASDDSKIGHVNCMSRDYMRDLMMHYFRQVFMFGMNDESLTTGFGPMCHYNIALCVE